MCSSVYGIVYTAAITVSFNLWPNSCMSLVDKIKFKLSNGKKVMQAVGKCNPSFAVHQFEKKKINDTESDCYDSTITNRLDGVS